MQAHVGAVGRPAPRRGSRVAFTVAVSVAMLLGAVVIAAVLLGAGAPGALAVGALLAVLPVGPLVGFFLWLDRYEPEPRGFLLLALGWGALVATSAALLVQALDQAVFGPPGSMTGALVAPFTEEAAKGLFVVLLLWRRHEIDGVLDGIVYGGMVGIGFAFTENILYLTAAYMGGAGLGPGGIEAATGTFIIRGVFSPFAHPLFTAMTGVGVGIAVGATRARTRVLAPLLGYAAAVAAHALWNGAAFLGGTGTFVLTYLFLMVPAFLLFVGLAVWVRRREATMLTRALTDCAGRGFLAPGEVPWLVRLDARRACRRHARAMGGPQGVRILREYQQDAVELGFLHHRFLRGTAPTDFAARGQALVERMVALRPWVVYPAGVPATRTRVGGRG